MKATICRRGFDDGRNTFTQSFGNRELDASLICTKWGGRNGASQRLHPSRLRCPHSSAKGFLSERAAGAEPRAARIMSMRARNAAGTCRCPG